MIIDNRKVTVEAEYKGVKLGFETCNAPRNPSTFFVIHLTTIEANALAGVLKDTAAAVKK